MSSTFIGYTMNSPSNGYQPNIMKRPPSPASPWQYSTTAPKPETMQHETGINLPPHTTPTTSSSQTMDYSSKTLNQKSPLGCNKQNMAFTDMYHPHLSPMYSEPTTSPKLVLVEQNSTNRSPNTRNIDNEDASKDTQMLEQSMFCPSVGSPKLDEGSCKDESKPDNVSEEYDENLRIPKVNSRRKIKIHKCKQCDFFSDTKLAHWKHIKTHIKPEKQLQCPVCPFVTEHKHHLKYHINKHLGANPYKCAQCDYSCPSKSMLNSHLKSHSNVYQYHCADCSFATKHCHSFKLHLRKNKHEPAVLLNPDGTPNPLLTVDIYGRRRGPKRKVQATEDSMPQRENIIESEPSLQNMQNPFGQFMLNVPPHMNGYPYSTEFSETVFKLLHLNRLVMAQQEDAQKNKELTSVSNDMEALNLSKLDDITKYKESEDDISNISDEDIETTIFSNVEVVHNNEIDDEEEDVAKNNYNCQYCEIDFRDPILHKLHMGYHGFLNPFVCNMCGNQCEDKVSFFLHIARHSHE